ncbi:MAG: alkaline phosphatase family protein [Peptococcaceae bacterium]|nr:alkaline phosphatase family protein [Peptococcaceae bacterium]
MKHADKVIVIGLDGMEPDTAKRMVDAGKMPNLKHLIDVGAARENLAMLGAMPTITPAQWTTLATGCCPNKHGITDFLNQDPVDIDTIVYGLDSRLCKAEQIWNVTANAGLRTLVWQWPGSSWPPSSESENLFVVDGTQPASVNYSIANIDIEKEIIASKDFEESKYISHVDAANAASGAVDCVIDKLDLEDDERTERAAKKEDDYGSHEIVIDKDDKSEIMLNRYKMRRLKNIDFHPKGSATTGVLSKIPFDKVEARITPAKNWHFDIPKDALEFAIYTSDGKLRRPCLIIKDGATEYNCVVIYKNKKTITPLVTLSVGEFATDIVDECLEEDNPVLATRWYKLLSLDPDGSKVHMWMSTAFKIDCDDRWSPKAIYKDVIENVGYVPPFSQMGGANLEFTKEIQNPVWKLNALWQARAINYLIKEKDLQVVFSHHHMIDHQAHQYWNFALQKEGAENEKEYQRLIDKVYEDTDAYIGEFMHLLDEGWTIFILSDHGEQIHYKKVARLGTAQGVSAGVMKELGWTVMKKDENGNELSEIDWEKTKAVFVRSIYIWINLKGRQPHGIVEPEDKKKVEEEIIDSLYNYRNEDGDRVVSIALRNKEAEILGLNGPDTGDIVAFNREGHATEHGSSLSTFRGAYGTTVSPIFVAAGKGIKHDADMERTIRQVDIAPTISMMLDLPMTDKCEGAPLYQIIE